MQKIYKNTDQTNIIWHHTSKQPENLFLPIQAHPPSKQALQMSHNQLYQHILEVDVEKFIQMSNNNLTNNPFKQSRRLALMQRIQRRINICYISTEIEIHNKKRSNLKAHNLMHNIQQIKWKI